MPQIMPEDGFIADSNLFVYANTPEEADVVAESIGIYFDGVSAGKDCACCGDRWTRAYFELDEETMLDLRADRLRYEGKN